jgi:D-glycero-alpha-D-manno-heptose 1-phosphate guanylyltransferase
MEAIILAGGFGTRLRQVVSDLPKPMAPVAGHPFLEILLTSLAAKGFHRVILSVGYMADKIVAHFGDQFLGMSLIYEIESSPLGTGGAIRRAMTKCMSDHVFVFNGDTYLDLEVVDVETHWQTQQLPIIVAIQVPDTTRYGCLKITDGRVSGFTEKGISGIGFINAGCYVLPTQILYEFPTNQPFSLEKDFLVLEVDKQRFNVFVTHGKFIDIGIPDDYYLAQTELANIICH